MTDEGVCNRGLGSGLRVYSWSLDGGDDHPVSTASSYQVQVVMNQSHFLQLNVVSQRQLVLDEGARLVVSNVTSPSIPGDDFWYDSGKSVGFVGFHLSSLGPVVGWSLDNGSINQIGSVNFFSTTAFTMNQTHVLHVIIEPRSSGCSAPSVCSSSVGFVFVDSDSPSASQVQVDGAYYSFPVSFAWPVGSSHTIVAPPGTLGIDSRAYFEGWSGSFNSTGASVTFTVTNVVRLRADYVTQYLTQFSFTDVQGGRIVPESVTLQGPGGIAALPQNYSAWLSYGAGYSLSSAIWKGSNVVDVNTSTSFRVLQPATLSFTLLIFPQSVTVRDPLGMAVAGASVTVDLGNGNKIILTSGPDGEVHFDAPLGVYQVSTSYLWSSASAWVGSMGSHDLGVTVPLSYPVLLMIALAASLFPSLMVAKRARSRHHLGLTQ